MRLSEYLVEGNRTERISTDDTISLLKGKHRKAAVSAEHSKKRIYRGLKGFGNQPYGYVRPSQFTRRSANTLNAYTLLIDNLPSWREYPKRSKSIICSTDYGRAMDYSDSGKPYFVFPENDAKIGVCGRWDIWDSFHKGFPSSGMDAMGEFGHSLRNLIMLAYDTNDPYIEEFRDWKLLLKNLSRVDSVKRSLLDKDPVAMDSIISSLYLDDYLEDRKMKLIDHLEKRMDPKLNGFDLKNVGDDLPDNREVWTDSDCLLIKKDIFMESMIGKYR